MARLDQISKRALTNWKEYYANNPAHKERADAKVFFVDGKLGTVSAVTLLNHTHKPSVLFLK